MRRTILKKKPGYTIALTLCIIGALMLLIVLWKTPSAMPTSSNPLFAFIESLWRDYPEISLGVGLKPIHYTILGVVMLILGGAILVGRRERVPVVEETTALLECPSCKNQWPEAISRAHLQSMGYPEVRALSRRKCPKCGKFIRPRITKIEK